MPNITATKHRIEGIIAGLTIGTYTEAHKNDYTYVWEIWTDQTDGPCTQKVLVSLDHQPKFRNTGDIRIGIYQGHRDDEATIPTMVWEYDILERTDYYIDCDDLASKISLVIWEAEKRQMATV